MRGIFKSGQKSILSKLYEDLETYQLISHMAYQDGVNAVSALLGCVTWAVGQKQGLDFWLQFKNSLGNSLEQQKEKLKAELIRVSLSDIMFLLLLLKKVSSVEKDWLATEVIDVKHLADGAKEVRLGAISMVLKLLPKSIASSVVANWGKDDTFLAQKAEYASFNTILTLLYLLPDDRISAFISNLDPVQMAAKAESTSLQNIVWLIKKRRP